MEVVVVVEVVVVEVVYHGRLGDEQTPLIEACPLLRRYVSLLISLKV